MRLINPWPRVCVIIPNYNGRENLRECLLSLRKLQYENFRVTIVDNGSTDGSCEMLNSVFREVDLIRLGRKVGYGAAVNKAIRKCAAKYVALLDNDTLVAPSWLRELVAHLEGDSNVGIGGSKVYFYGSTRRLYSAGGLINSKNGFVQVLGLGEIDRGQHDRPQLVDWVAGCSMVVRMDLMARIGYLDEDYELYREEVDLCYRGKRAGYKVLYVPSSVVWHKVSQTSSRLGTKFYYLHRSWIRFSMVNLSPIYAVLGAIFAVVFTMMEATGHLGRGSAKELTAAVYAILWNLLSLRGTLNRRALVNWTISNAPVDG